MEDTSYSHNVHGHRSLMDDLIIFQSVILIVWWWWPSGAFDLSRRLAR